MDNSNPEFIEFETQEDAERSFVAKQPSILYKYRDWTNEYHKRYLTIPSIYFANPKDLNDPFDIRVPYEFDYEEIKDPKFYEKLKRIVAHFNPCVNPDSREFKVLCENRFDLIQKDPKAYFETNFLAVRDGSLYEALGLFSLSKVWDNITMWGYYSNSHKGVCIGYDTLGLFKSVPSGCGEVHYTNNPLRYSFLDSEMDRYRAEEYWKQKQWEHEQEYRFLTFIESINGEREVAIPLTLIKEVILGREISVKHQDEIKSILSTKYKSLVKLYKVAFNVTSYRLERNEIVY